jgi:hypothetical protein
MTPGIFALVLVAMGAIPANLIDTNQMRTQTYGVLAAVATSQDTQSRGSRLLTMPSRPLWHG